MDDLFQTDSSFPFDDIKLKTPRALQGGTYTANLSVNDNNIIIQTPKCKTKKGITKTAKQLYCDLLFNQDHNDFIDWLETFQERIRELIFENSDNWFHESPSLDDIEYNWNNSIRTYKQTNYLVRTFIHKTKNVKSVSLQIYDSEQKELKIEDVDKDKNVISILEIVGIKFSSQSFQLDICLRQLMVLNEKPIFNKCLIRLDKPKQLSNNEKSLGENKKSQVLENIIVNTSEKRKNINKDNNENNDEDNNEDNDEDNNEDNNEENTKNEIQNKEEEHQHFNSNSQEQETNDNQNKNNKMENLDNNNNDGVEETDDVEEVANEIQTGEDNEEKNEKQNIVLKNEVKKEIDGEKEKQNLKDLEKIDGLEEIEINVNDNDEIKLKKPNEVYLDIYKEARNKARLAKKAAIKAYLEAKKIKELYMLDEIDSSSSESEEDLDEEDGEIFSES